MAPPRKPKGARTGATARRYWPVSSGRSQSESADIWREVSWRAARGLRRRRGEFGPRFRLLRARGRGECSARTKGRPAPAPLVLPARPERKASPAPPLLAPARRAELCRFAGCLGESREGSPKETGPGRGRAVPEPPGAVGPSRPRASDRAVCLGAVTGRAQPRALPGPHFPPEERPKRRPVRWPSTAGCCVLSVPVCRVLGTRGLTSVASRARSKETSVRCPGSNPRSSTFPTPLSPPLLQLVPRFPSDV